MSAIIVKNLTKNYGEKVAVDNLSFEVKKGTVFGLLGANGAGKSTTIECILGTKKADSGEARILEMNPTKERTRLFERVGVQFQEANYQEQIKVEELCEMTAAVYKKPRNYAELLEEFGISDKKKTLENRFRAASGSGFLSCSRLSQTPRLYFWTSSRRAWTRAQDAMCGIF